MVTIHSNANDNGGSADSNNLGKGLTGKWKSPWQMEIW